MLDLLAFVRQHTRMIPTFGLGSSGWVRHDAEDGLVAYLRFTPSPSGRFTVSEVFLDATSSGSALSSRRMGTVPIRQIEAAINQDPTLVRELMDSPAGGPASGSNLAVLASHSGVSFGPPDPGESMSWVQAAQHGERVNRFRKPRRRAQPLDDYRLDSGPGSDGLTDGFLARVSRAYAAAVARGESPNKIIAADVFASPRSVERWVYEARRRGVMPPARGRGARG